MKRIAGRLTRGLVYGFVGLAVLLVLSAGAIRFWLPKLGDYRLEVERLLSDYIGQEIAMTSLNATWDGLNMTFKAEGVRVAVEDHPGSGMRFGEIVVSFHPLNLLGGKNTFERLKLMGPTIEVSRLPDGRIRVGDTIIGTPRGVVRRLLRGGNLEIANGTLIWRDALAPEENLHIEDVDIRVRSSGDRRRFEFTASAPPELMEEFRADGSYDPRSLKSGSWSAGVNISVEHLNLARIPTVIQERLPWRSQGRIDTEFRAEWIQGVLTAASADMMVRDFVIPYAKDKKPISAKRFSSSVSWRGSEKEWSLVFADPEILLDDTPVSVSRFEVRRHGGRRIYSGRDVIVQDLWGVLNRLDIELPWNELMDGLRPSGVFSQAALTLTGPYLETSGWRFEGDFRNVGWRAQERYPGVRGLDGRLIVGDKQGELLLASTTLELDAANLMRHPIGFTRVEGRVEWYRWGRDWVVDVSDGIVINDDLSLKDVDFYTRVPTVEKESPFVLARARIQRADINAVRDYLPVKLMAQKQIAWLDRALAGGEITQGRFYLNGALDDFPYDSGTGELQVSARIKNGVLDFNENWPNFTGLEGVIEIDNSRFEARAGQGVMMNSPIQSVRVWCEDFFRRDRVVFVQGELRARADDVIQFLRRGPLNKNPPPPYSRMAAEGDGILNLAIELPFTRLKEASRVRGEYAFDSAGLQIGGGIEFTNLSGTVRFTESTVQGTALKGELFGGPFRADLTTVKAGQPISFALTGTGEADVSRLTPVVGPVLVSRLQGRAKWEGRFVARPGLDKLEVRSNLNGVDVLLPDPLWKPKRTESALDVQVDFDRDSRRIAMDFQDRLRGELHYERKNDKQVLVRGVLNLGSDRGLPEDRLSVAVKGEHIDMDRWIEEIDTLSRRADKADSSEPERDALFDHLRSLDVDVDRFRYLNRNLGPVEIHATTDGNRRWAARFVGPRLRGTGRMWLGRTPKRFDFNLTRLHWPRLQNIERATTYEQSPEPSEFAHLSIRADDFRYGEMRFGRLDFQGGPAEHAWRIKRMSLQQPAMRIDAKGRWSSDRFGAHRTRVDVSIDSNHLGKSLAQLGLKDQVAKGKAEMTADLSWPGGVGEFDLAKLNGELSFTAEDGRFLKLQPGSGRLLGLFNAESLTRRLKLDFTDIFNDGLAFDRIDGDAAITTGRLRTDGIFIIGPAALIELSGSTSLAEETYDLNVAVAPQLGGNLSLAGAIVNPAAGAMIFLVQKLFKKQMANLINHKYRVTGDWDAPRVKAVEHPATDATEQLGRN